MTSLRVLVAPSGFKESLSPEAAANCIEEGLMRVLDSSSVIRKLPLHDGGEGFCQALVASRKGQMKEMEVMGPTRQMVQSYYGLFGKGNKTAVLDMASAAGLRLVPQSCRDPSVTTSYGVGQLISAALDEGVDNIIVGCGDSGTSDGGVGMLQALGFRFFDRHGNELPVAAGGGSLISLHSIDVDGIHPRLKKQSNGSQVRIEAVCNIQNILCGRRGVSRIYGPQKGATPEQVALLSQAMDNLAAAAKGITDLDLSATPGAGASGGLGAGLILIGAKLRARVEAIDEYFGMDRIFDQPWDIVFTAEGSLDYQSSKGKMTVEIARRARAHGAQVIALAGTISKGADEVYNEGITAFTSILPGPLSLDKAIEQAPELLTNASERTMRMLQVGLAINSLHRQPSTPKHNPLLSARIYKHSEVVLPTQIVI